MANDHPKVCWSIAPLTQFDSGTHSVRTGTGSVITDTDGAGTGTYITCSRTDGTGTGSYKSGTRTDVIAIGTDGIGTGTDDTDCTENCIDSTGIDWD